MAGASAHLVLLVRELDLEVLRGPDHGLHGGEDVLVHQLGEAPLVLVCVAGPVDDPHLFDEGALAALTGTWGAESTGGCKAGGQP